MTDHTQPAGEMQWTDEQHEAYALGMQTEREHQEALARLVMKKHEAELAALRDTTTQLDGSWLAMMREIAKLADAMEPDDVKWCDADDANLLEEFDPWQTLRELAALRAEARWTPVGDGIVFHETDNVPAEWNYPAHTESIAFLEVRNNSGSIACGSMPKEDEHEVDLPPDYRVCRLVPGQDTLKEGEDAGQQ